MCAGAMSLFVLLSVVSIVPTLAAKWSGSGFTSNASSTPVVSQYAFAPQLWAQPLPTAVGNNVAASTRVYESMVNATHTLQVLSTVDGNVTTLLTSTNPTAPATIYGTGTLTSFAQNPGQVLTAGPGTTPTSVVIATTRAVFMFDTSFNFDGKSNPCIFQPDGPILAVAWAPTTGLYLVVQSTMLIWWNASTDMIAAPTNVTTPLVGPATAQCSSDGVCWIGDSVATFVVVYTNSAVIQTMPMRGQWPTDAAMAPMIKPVGGRRAVMAWGVRVGLLTSQQAGNLGMDWKATQTSNTTALGVFPMLGQRGLVVTGHNVSVTVYDLADGSTIGSNGQLQGQLLSGVTYRWTSIEVDTSAQPYLLLASGLNCAASWALVNATGALATAPPAWSAADVLNGFGAFTATYLPSNAASAQGSPWWLIQERQSIDYYSAVLVSPRQQSVVCTLQNRELGGSFVSAVASSTHMIVVVAGPQAIFGIDAAAGPLLAPIATASVFASTLDPATQTTFVVAWDKELGQMSALKVAFGATTPTLITTWPAANKTTVSFIQDATLALVSNGKLLLSGDFYASSGFSTLWFGAVVDVTSGIVLFQQASASGVAGAFIDTVNNALAFMTQTTYNVVNSTGATTSFALSVNATVFTFVAQWNNRVLVSLTASGGYWLLDARTGAVLKNQEPSTAYPAFSNDGGILDCVFDDATSVTTLNQYTVNLTLQHSIQVFCNSAPLQTPDGSVYFSAVGALDPHTSMVPTYLARANFDNVAQTPAVELWRSVGGGVGKMIYNAAQQLMVYWDPNSGMQACVDLIRGFTLWNHTAAALGVTYSKVSAAQGVVPGAMNVLWADPVPSKFMKTAINLFTGDIIESVLGDTHDDMTYVTSQVINGVNRPVMIVVQAQGTATWTNFAVTDVATPLGFRSSAQPLFTTPLLPQSAVSTPSPPGGSKSPGTGGGGGSDAVGIGIGVTVGIVVVLAIGAFLFLRSRRHTNDTVVDPAYQAMPHTTVRSAASAV